METIPEAPAVQAPPGAGSVFRKYRVFLYCFAAGFFVGSGIFGVAYRHVVTDNVLKEKTIADQKKVIERYKVASRYQIRYSPTGVKIFESGYNLSEGASERESSHSLNDVDKHDHKDDTTKKFSVGIAVLFDPFDPLPYVPKQGSVDTSIIGPLGAQGAVQRDPFKALVGPHFNF